MSEDKLRALRTEEAALKRNRQVALNKAQFHEQRLEHWRRTGFNIDARLHELEQEKTDVKAVLSHEI